MGSGTHCSKIDGFLGTQRTHANGAADYFTKEAKCQNVHVSVTIISNVKTFEELLPLEGNTNKSVSNLV